MKPPWKWREPWYSVSAAATGILLLLILIVGGMHACPA
jgi:hypothetical protein